MQEAQNLAGLHHFQIRPFASNLGFLESALVMETFHKRKADTGDKVEFLAEVGVLAQKQGKQLIPLNHLPSSLKARLHLGWGEGLHGCCINQRNWELPGKPGPGLEQNVV